MKVFNKKFVAHLKPDILIPGGIEVLSHGLSPIEKWPVLGPPNLQLLNALINLILLPSDQAYVGKRSLP